LYLYDAEGQLCAVQSQALPGLPITQYVYDAEGARIAKGTLSAAPSNSTSLCAPPLSSGFTLSARYLVDQGGDQVTEINGAGQWQHSNVFSAARLTATYDYNSGNGGLHFELADPLGTKRVQANIYGQIEMSWVSLPFGDALTPILPPNPPSPSGGATQHHFTQKERDSESNNDYFFARYYNSAIGRFTTPDWSVKVEPVPYAQMGDPQSLNLYAYVRNNPLIHVDADGHEYPDRKNAQIIQQAKLENSTGPIMRIPGFSDATVSAFNEIRTCDSALAIANKDRRAVARADAAWDVLQTAASAHNIPTSLLAAVGVEETGFRNVQEKKQNGQDGPGMGVFQLTNQPGVTKEQAFNLPFAANFAAKMLSDNWSFLSKTFPSFDLGSQIQATGASYNFGAGNIRGNPMRIDVGTKNGHYGSDVLRLMSCFPY